MESNQLSNDVILRFLRLAYFGNIDEPYNAAGDRAYRDFCRTVDFPKTEQKLTRQEQIQRYIERQKKKKKIYNWLQDELLELNCKNSKEFDSWHCRTCKKIIEDFSKEAKLHYGQAQKWLNMTLKYLLVLGRPEANRQIAFLHVPIDNIVIQTASEHVKPCRKPWSQWNENDYKDYQERLKSYIGQIDMNMPPIIWEFRNWIPTDMFNN